MLIINADRLRTRGLEIINIYNYFEDKFLNHLELDFDLITYSYS